MRKTAIAAALLGALLLATEPAVAQEGGLRPSFRAGDMLRVDLRANVQGDWRGLASASEEGPRAAFELHRARVGIDGTFLRLFEYQVEREFSGPGESWRDVYVNLRPVRAFQLQAGAFKIPFSREQLTGSASLDFAYRSLTATYLAPGRDRGVMAHGSVGGGVVKYQAGVFRRGGENVRAAERADPQSGKTVAGRFVVKPFQGRPPHALRSLRTGIAVTSGRVPEGLNSLRGRTVGEDTLFHPVMVNGSRRRVGGEVDWHLGRASLAGEVMHVSDQRLGQGTDDEDLPAVVARGWYVSGTWRLMDRTDARRTHLPGLLRPGIGVVDLGVRVEELRFGDQGDAAALSVRARTVQAKRDRVVTAGVSWSPNPWVRLQANVMRERRMDHALASPAAAAWSHVLRLQFAL